MTWASGCWTDSLAKLGILAQRVQHTVLPTSRCIKICLENRVKHVIAASESAAESLAALQQCQVGRGVISCSSMPTREQLRGAMQNSAIFWRMKNMVSVCALAFSALGRLVGYTVLTSHRVQRDSMSLIVVHDFEIACSLHLVLSTARCCQRCSRKFEKRRPDDRADTIYVHPTVVLLLHQGACEKEPKGCTR